MSILPEHLIETLFIVALLGTMAAIAGPRALRRGGCGRLGALASLVGFTGSALLLVSAIASALMGRDLLAAVFAVGLYAMPAGLVLLGAAALRARLLPGWCEALLIAGFSVVAFVGGEVFKVMLLGAMSVLVGYALLSQSGRPATRARQASGDDGPPARKKTPAEGRPRHRLSDRRKDSVPR